MSNNQAYWPIMNNPRLFRFTSWRLFVSAALTLLSLMNTLAYAEEHRFNVQGVLGTSMDVTFHGVDKQQAEQALIAAQTHIEKLQSSLSSWQQDSAITMLNNTHKLNQAPNELVSVLTLCEKWLRNSNNYFSCRLGEFKQQWQTAQSSQTLPNRVALRTRARALARMPSPIHINDHQIVLEDGVVLDIDGIAKGWIIDSTMRLLKSELPQSTGIKLDIGGDLLLAGKPATSDYWQVGVNANDTDKTATLAIPSGAIATSGHSERFYEIDRQKFSHLLAPKEGWPVEDAPSATVFAADAATADAIATALSVQNPTKGIDWVNQLQGVEALVEQGQLAFASDGWNKLVNSDTSNSALAKLRIDYQIPNISATQYHRPYLAIWLTTTDNQVVRHLLLLGESERWAKENKRWWRRAGRRTPGILDAISRPTRRPGKYHIIWDGLDDNGKPASNQNLVLHIEAAREVGGHNYKKIVLNNSPIALDAEGELGVISVTY